MNLTSILKSNNTDNNRDQQRQEPQQQLQRQQQQQETGFITDRLSSFNLSSGSASATGATGVNTGQGNQSLANWDEESRRSTASNTQHQTQYGHFASIRNRRYLTEATQQHLHLQQQQHHHHQLQHQQQPHQLLNLNPLNFVGIGMPRAKRRAAATNHSDMANPPEEQRHPSKRQRHTSSGRRHTRADDGGANHHAAQLQQQQQQQQQAFSQKRCINWFREYTTPDDAELLGPEGMEKFCEDIGVEPENVVMLVLAYKMGARQMGFFTLAEWLKGLTDLQCDSAAKVKHKLDHLRNLLNDHNVFKGIYRYAYDFARDKDQRSMDMETARVMLQLLLGRHWPLFSQFAKFLDQSKYKVINKDQWFNILEFSRTINNDLSNYDLDGAWPVMLDEFVEWLKAQQQGDAASQMDARSS